MSLPRRSIAGAGGKSKPARLEHGEGGRGDLAGVLDVAGAGGSGRWGLSSCHPVPVAPAHVSLEAEQTNGARQTARRDAAADGTRGGAARWPAGRGGVERERGARVTRVGAVGGYPRAAGGCT